MPTETVTPPEREQPPAETASSETTQLEIEVGKKLGQDEALTELARGVVKRLLAIPKGEPGTSIFADPKIEASLTALRTEFSPQGHLTNPLVEQHWEEMAKGLKWLLEERPDFLAGFPDGPSEGYRNPKEDTLAALATLLLRGSISQELLEEIAGGGIAYASEKAAADQHETMEDVGHFVRNDKDGKSRIYLYPRAFKEATVGPDGQPTEGEADLQTLVSHELSHALLRYDHLLAPAWNDLEKLIKNPETTEETPTLFGVERRLLARLFRQPERQAAWEPPYIRTITQRYAAERGDLKLRAHLVEERRAEALRIFLQSDGGFTDYLTKRLEQTSFLQDFLKKVDAGGRSSDLNLDRLAPGFKTFVGGITTDRLFEAPAFVAFETQVANYVNTLPDDRFDPATKEQCKDFLIETAVLHRRFAPLRTKEGKAQLLRAIKDGQVPALEEFDDAAIGAGLSQADPLPSAAPPKKAGPGFWQIIFQALAQFGQAVR